MSPIPLRDHPLDIQQYIIESIDSPRDLLALALSSKHYHDLIVPYHIQFRTLRCSVQRTDIWAALSVKKYLCARFRTLEIIHCPHSRYWYSDIVPSCVVNRQSQARAPLCRIIPPPADEEERQRKAVIDDICVVCQSMTSLQSFRWFDGVEVDNALMPRLNEILSAIYQSGPQLRSMIILSSVPSILDRPSVRLIVSMSAFVTDRNQELHFDKHITILFRISWFNSHHLFPIHTSRRADTTMSTSSRSGNST